MWWHSIHTVAPEPAAAKPPDEEGTKVTHDEHGNTVITMSDEDQGDAGIVFANPTAGQWSPETKGYGRTMDPAALSEVVNELVSARAASHASELEWERQKMLNGQTNTSVRALQTAEAAAQHDQLAVAALRDKLTLVWGKAIAERADLPEFAKSLAARQAALVRVDLLAGDVLDPPPASARLVTLSDKTLKASFVAPATDVDPQTQGQGLIFLVQPSDPALSPGTAVTAWLPRPGEAIPGVIIPRDSVVRFEGSGWIYLMNKDKGGEAFTRTTIPLDRPTENGWFVTGTVKPEDYIVVTGAQMLLSQELKAAMSPD